MPDADGLVLAVDQGTGSTKALLVDRDGAVAGAASAAIGQSHPRPGWVEQDPEEIWASVGEAVRGLDADLVARVQAVALSNQRETVVLWERATGRALAPALGWQDQRTVARAEELERAGRAPYVLAASGLPLDPMFSALKAAWLLDEVDPDRERARAGELCVGTVDAWLLSRLGGDPVIEVGNASRTQLLDISTGAWDPELLEIFDVPEAALPRVVPSTGPFPAVTGLAPVPDGTPVLGVMADSHAALFAHAGWRPGVVKATYGTGSSVMALGTGSAARTGVCATIAWQVDDLAHAVEANIRSTGRTLTWLADLFDVPVDDVVAEAATADRGGVTLVPAFGGLGAPWWDPSATAIVSHLSLGTRREQLSRAALESIAHQVDDALVRFGDVAGPVRQVNADGGLTASEALMQLQADVSGVPVEVSATSNLSALGAAHLAGVTLGWWTLRDLETRAAETRPAARHDPTTSADERLDARTAWHGEISRSRLATAPTTRPEDLR